MNAKTNVSGITEVWQKLHEDKKAQAEKASGPLKTHLENEAKQIKLTVDAMDIADGGAAAGSSQTGAGDIDGPGPAVDTSPATPVASSPASSVESSPASSVDSSPVLPPADLEPPGRRKNLSYSDPPPMAEQPPAKPAESSPSSPSTSTLAASTASSSDVDSNAKLKTLQPLIDSASAASGISSALLGAVMVKESRGVSIDAMGKAGGLMQMGEQEFKETAARHPELKGIDWQSTEGQIKGAAFRLADFKQKSGSWDGALTMYNGGEFRGGLVDPNYLTRVHEYENTIKNGGTLPS